MRAITGSPGTNRTSENTNTVATRSVMTSEPNCFQTCVTKCASALPRKAGAGSQDPAPLAFSSFGAADGLVRDPEHPRVRSLDVVPHRQYPLDLRKRDDRRFGVHEALDLVSQ